MERKTLEERMQLFLEKNVPTSPSKWAYWVGQAKKKFDVYPCKRSQDDKNAGGREERSKEVNLFSRFYSYVKELFRPKRIPLDSNEIGFPIQGHEDLDK